MDIERRNGRIQDSFFRRNVLGPGTEIVGRMDGRYLGHDYEHTTTCTRDPSLEAPWAAFTATANRHLRDDLGWEGDDDYQVLSMEVNQAWAWTRDKRFGTRG